MYLARMAKKKTDPVLEAIRAALHEANLTHVAEACKISIVQVRKIRDGDTKNPRWDTMCSLSKHLKVPLC